MSHKFADITFTPTVKKFQEIGGSRSSYARFDDGPEHHNRLGKQEAAFLTARDSFYMASVSETGWPYIQHRGGPKGFLKILDTQTLGFADFQGNKQYISVGNLTNEARVSLFFMDYDRKIRLKLLGRAEILGSDKSQQLADLVMPEYPSSVERGILIHIEAFDWNCPQHITQRFTLSEIEAEIQPLRQRLQELEALLAAQKQAD